MKERDEISGTHHEKRGTGKFNTHRTYIETEGNSEEPMSYDTHLPRIYDTESPSNLPQLKLHKVFFLYVLCPFRTLPIMALHHLLFLVALSEISTASS